IIDPTLIKKIDHAVGSKAPRHNRNRVDDQTNPILAAAQRLFGALALGNVLRDSEGPAGATLLVTKYVTLAVKPAHAPVRTHDAVFDVVTSKAGLRFF